MGRSGAGEPPKAEGLGRSERERDAEQWHPGRGAVRHDFCLIGSPTIRSVQAQTSEQQTGALQGKIGGLRKLIKQKYHKTSVTQLSPMASAWTLAWPRLSASAGQGSFSVRFK